MLRIKSGSLRLWWQNIFLYYHLDISTGSFTTCVIIDLLTKDNVHGKDLNCPYNQYALSETRSIFPFLSSVVLRHLLLLDTFVYPHLNLKTKWRRMIILTWVTRSYKNGHYTSITLFTVSHNVWSKIEKRRKLSFFFGVHKFYTWWVVRFYLYRISWFKL